ncbi:MAG: HAD-IIB family hydrolase [Desulfobacteraceae bacterium]|nr:MAG: HAD-IIB family hydrolase [Desulfobacteraceae bacterium]
MLPFSEFPGELKSNIGYVLTDIDDTLTSNGRLPALVFTAMENLKMAGIRIVPITGRPAGWCDHIARMWPVDGLVGENGAFYYSYDWTRKKMLRRYWKTEKDRKKDRKKLDKIKHEILKKIPGCAVASDQAFREADLAIDYCEDVPPLTMEDAEEIAEFFHVSGARAKISSIHVNGWFGDYDKLAMTRLFFEEVFNENLESVKDQVIFTGDSPNDSPMFGYFPSSVGVANVLHFRGKMTHEPAWVTEKEGGHGFAEMVETLLSRHRSGKLSKGSNSDR